jgi:hypothetical protein
MSRLTSKVLVAVPLVTLFLLGCDDGLGGGADLVAPPDNLGPPPSACAGTSHRTLTRCSTVTLHATPERMVVARA